ncbi:hypothetical protein J4N45_10090 [Vibrio sp. SCSIO 43140]|uniref:hypothetical protein n=1 Tax=Vibrio sp. SCSIO 43140 TaxID=2819100 RepID=UPI002075A012|nr:hypothetical protein [Vibrio sp. SCSIO 43140]USD58879.1 hypothetical protein J4N45_10090 [Vibrio sp. SCSIO 43140]
MEPIEQVTVTQTKLDKFKFKAMFYLSVSFALLLVFMLGIPSNTYPKVVVGNGALCLFHFIFGLKNLLNWFEGICSK